MKTILVTGGAGFIGSHFIKFLLLNTDLKVVNLDALTYSGNLDNLKGAESDDKYTFVHGNVKDENLIFDLFEKYKFDYVINFAAETHVDRSIHVGSKEFIDTNVTGVYSLLEAIKKYGLEKALFVSTDEVYGSLSVENKKEKFHEYTQYQPNVPYSATKAGGDMLCRAYYFTWKLPLVVTHCSNNYGPYQYPEKLIPFFTMRALEDKPLPLYGDGKNIRDWIYVLDHVVGLYTALIEGKPGEVYNMGADNELENIQIAKTILNILGKPEDRLEYVKDRPGHDRRYAIDATKIKRELGWAPVYNFESAIIHTVNWYKNNLDWIKNIQDKTGVINPHIDLWKPHNL